MGASRNDQWDNYWQESRYIGAERCVEIIRRQSNLLWLPSRRSKRKIQRDECAETAYQRQVIRNFVNSQLFCIFAIINYKKINGGTHITAERCSCISK